MASRTLYPAIVDSYMPAFKAGNTRCRVYFSLSKFNSSSDFTSVHISVVKQNTGMNVVKTTDDPANSKYRSTGIIINAKATRVLDEDNLYYVEIEDDDLSSVSGTFAGWIPGWVYKIQLRLSARDYDGSIGQAAWLNNNSIYFSEWSTVCVVKATGRIDYSIPIFSIDTRDENTSSNDETQTIYTTTLQLAGSFYRETDPSELIHSYSFTLYNEQDEIIESSGDIYANQYQDNDSFNYLMKTELQDGVTYKLAFHYITINKYEDGFYRYNNEKDDRLEFVCSAYSLDVPPCVLVTAENDAEEILKDITSVHEEEEEGRIGVKFYASEGEAYSGNLCIRRADSRDNFQTWTDVYLYTCKQEDINLIPIFYDYTIESGIWYKYGVQVISTNGDRGVLRIITKPALRNFNYSFLLGQNNQQLKLMFDNSMNTFKYQIYDSNTDPVGSRYTKITRNANTYYRIFPLNGLVSFWMDENDLFCNKTDIYKYDDVVDLYNNYNKDNNILQYDYIYERDFRDKVLTFLQDGEPKLFKSPTEGNIIIRLKDVNCTPNQSLDRMLYSFTSNAYELDEPTMDNYRKYSFYSVKNYETTFSTYETKLGQLSIDFNVGDNVFQKIYQKYDSHGENYAGYRKTLVGIHHIKITFDEKPLRVQNSAGEIVVGNNFMLNGRLFTVYDPIRMYEFDERLIYTPNDYLIIMGDAENKASTVHATIDFLYELETDIYVSKEVQSRIVKQGAGQVFIEAQPQENIYKEIYYKYFIEWSDEFRRLSALSSIEIESNPGAAFSIKDAADAEGEIHVVGATGQLRFYNIEDIKGIKYLGVMNNSTGEIEPYKTDVLVNYLYLVTKGAYKIK